MTDKEKIRAFIERLHKEHRGGAGDSIFRRALRTVLHYIDSMQEEPTGDIDFEQELYKAFGQIKDFTLGLQIAKKFYEIGRLSSVERIGKYWKEELVSEDLEKAAIKYAQDKYMPVQTSQAFKAGAQWQKQQMMKGHLDFTIMKAQYCNEHLPPLKDLAQLPLIRFSPAKLLERGLKVGDKVKVIIIKEN